MKSCSLLLVYTELSANENSLSVAELIKYKPLIPHVLHALFRGLATPRGRKTASRVKSDPSVELIVQYRETTYARWDLKTNCFIFLISIIMIMHYFFIILFLLLLLWQIFNGRGLPNCLTELPSLKCLSSSLHSRDSHPFAYVLRPSPSGSPSASPTLTCALQE